MPSKSMFDPRLDYPEPQQQYLDPELARKLEMVVAAAAAVASAQKLHRHSHEQLNQVNSNYQTEFTYSFPKIERPKEGEDMPFAVAPNDPRYYEEDATENREYIIYNIKV